MPSKPLIATAALSASLIVAATSAVRAGDVQGSVVMGPMCPGPAQIGVDCPPQPVATTVDIFAFRSDGAIAEQPTASVATDGSGHFQLSLSPGRYWFVPRPPQSDGIASGKPSEVVVAGETIAVTLNVDTGMR